MKTIKRNRKSEVRAINPEHLKGMISEEIEKLTDLRSRIGDHGTSLNYDESKMIRNILAGTWLRECIRELEMSFRIGYSKDVESNLDYISNVMKQFSE